MAARVKHGTNIGHRIAMTWRAAMYLDKEYVDVIKTKDPYILLESAIQEDCLNKLDVISDIMTSMQMSKQEVSFAPLFCRSKELNLFFFYRLLNFYQRKLLRP